LPLTALRRAERKAAVPDLSIRILSTEGGVAFDPCSAPPSSTVTWNNQTRQTHQITSGTFSTDPILAGMSSRPDFVIDFQASGTIDYFCTLHENEAGTIVVTPVQPMPPEGD
jgi:plastocyanin